MLTANATREAVLSSLQTKLEKLSKVRGSVFIFYYGGHGVGTSGGAESTSSSSYIAMQGAEVSDGKRTFGSLLLLDEILAIQADYPKVYFFGFIDACFSGNYSLKNRFLEVSKANSFLMCSSGGDRQSYDMGFTKTLNDIFKDEVKYSKILTPDHLFKMVRDAHGEKINEFQIPVLMPEPTNLKIIYPSINSNLVFIIFDKPVPADLSIRVIAIDDDDGSTSEYYWEGSRIADNFGFSFGRKFLAFGLPNKGVTLMLQIAGQEEEFSVHVPANSGLTYHPHKPKNLPKDMYSYLPSDEPFMMSSYLDAASSLGLSADAVDETAINILREMKAPGGAIKELLAYSPDIKQAEELKILAGLTDYPEPSEEYFVKLNEARVLGIQPSPAFTLAYSQHLRENVRLLQEENEPWIAVNDLTDEFITSAEMIRAAADQTSYTPEVGAMVPLPSIMPTNGRAITLDPLTLDAMREIRIGLDASVVPKYRVLSTRDYERAVRKLEKVETGMGLQMER